MPPVVAAPAVVIGAAGAFWYSLTLLFGLDTASPARFISGAVLGLGGFALLATSPAAPADRVVPPPWRHSIGYGLLCTVAMWFVSAAAVDGWSHGFIAVLGGLSCTAAGRRTAASRNERIVHQITLVLIMLAALERVINAIFLDHDPYLGLGILISALAAVFLPVERFQRWSLRLVPGKDRQSLEKPQDIREYRNEVLALAAFLAPTDIPKSLAVAAAQAAGAGRASSLRTLAPVALTEVGADSLSLNPIMQEFAWQRMLAEERKEWATRAVRMLAGSFPENYWDAGTWPRCERLLPHAVAAAAHAEKLDVARGAAAVLLDRAGGYLAECGRRAEARALLTSAVSHAAAGFGDTAEETATMHAHLARLNEPGNTTVDLSTVDAPSARRPDSPDRTSLALHFASLGDTHRDAGDAKTARRHYLSALTHARYALGRKHPLVADLRGRLNALPGPTRAEADEKRLVLGCFSLVVAALLICVGFALFRNVGDEGMRAADDQLTSTAQLAELCDSSPRYFPDAAPFTGQPPHPARFFRRTETGDAFQPEPYQPAPAPAQATQLVGCAVQTRTGPRIAMCKYTDQPEIPLHQATYLLTVYETRTGIKLGTQTITAPRGQCPASYDEPAEDQPWMLYAGPGDDQYQQALVPIEDVLTTRPS